MFCIVLALGLKQQMPPHCNKCKWGIPAEGDSWCIGCSSTELAQELLRQRWLQPGVRRVAEEALLSSARQVRAFANLDRALGESGAGRGAGPSTRGAGQSTVPPPPPVPERSNRSTDRSRSPQRDRRPPLRRSDRRIELHPKRAARAPAEPLGEEYSEEEEEEEENREDPPVEVKREESHRRVPEPENPPRRRRSQKKPRKKKRGVRKHQRHYRERDQPLKSSHRRLKGSILELASSVRSGLERRI